MRRKQISDNQLCEPRLLLDYAHHRASLHSCDSGLLNCRCGKRPQRPAHETALTKKVTLPQDRERRYFTAPGCNCEFHVAILDVEHRIRGIALAKNGLFISVLPRVFCLPIFFRRSLEVKLRVCLLTINSPKSHKKSWTTVRVFRSQLVVC